MKVHLFVFVSCEEDRCKRQEKCESLTVRKWCSGWHERGRELDEEERVSDKEGSDGFFSSGFLLWVGSRGGRGVGFPLPSFEGRSKRVGFGVVEEDAKLK